MRIGIDCRSMQTRGGIAVYTHNLVKNLLIQDKFNDYVLFFDASYSQELKKHTEQENCSVKYFPKKIWGHGLPFLYSHYRVSNFLNKQNLDVFHAPTGSLPFFYRGRAVITIHDLAIYKHPEWFPAGQWFAKRIVVPKSLKRAKMIIAVSEATERDLQDLFHIPKPKIKVIYEGGLDLARVAKKLENKGQDYILTISTLEPRKNLTRLIEAFGLYYRKNHQNKLKLVIVGGEGWKFKEIYQTVADLGLQKQVIFTGFVSEKRKISLLQGARALVFPSFYEGFGLPVVEAMSLGVPVICGQNSALGEICDNAAYFIDPYSAPSIAQGLRKVLGDRDLQSKLKVKGLKRAENFSWRKCAGKTIEVYRSVGAGLAPART